MGKFTNWMMGMEDGDDSNDKKNQGRQNNYDRHTNRQDSRERPERDDRNKRFSSYNNYDDNPDYTKSPYQRREPLAQFEDSVPVYQDDKLTYLDPRPEYTRAPEPKMDTTSTLPLMDGGNGGSIRNVVLYSPKSFQDVQTLIDFLKASEPSVIDLGGVRDSSAQRILDFLSGAIYAINGSIHRISGTIFILTPSGVTITVPNDVKRRLEGK